jgi:hypothetical protein
MKPRLLRIEEIDRPCSSAQAAMTQALVDAKLPRRSWLRRMWWRLTGRGGRYSFVFTHGVLVEADGKERYMTRPELDALAQTCSTGREVKHGT